MKPERSLPDGIKAASQGYEVLIDNTMHAVSGGAWKVLCYVARRTLGFGKQVDSISLSQICRGIRRRDGRRLDHGTGLSRKAAVRALQELVEERKILTRERKGGAKANVYSLNWGIIRSQKETNSESPPPSGGETIPNVVDNRNTQQSVQLATLQPTRKDLDYQTTNRQNRDSRSGTKSECKQYPRLREMLAECFEEPGHERSYPSDRLVVDVMHAASGASESEVIECLRYLRYERGLKPGSDGVRHWSWFPVAVKDNIERQRAMCTPPAAADVGLNQQRFDAMLAANEL